MAESTQAHCSNYTLGHDDATLKAHQERTANVVAAYLLPHIRSSDDILDVGCGPGTITLGLAGQAPEGRTVGIDYSSTAIEAAKKAAEADGAPKNAEFKTGDAYALEWKDASFDVVHAHQCLIHLADPVQALREMQRVCKAQGRIGVREADFGGFTLYPEIPLVQKTFEIWAMVMRSGGSEPDAGRRLGAWARKAGFESANIQVTASVEVYSTRARREFIAMRFAERLLQSEVGRRAVELGITMREEIQEIADAWKTWIDDEDGYLGMTSTELLYFKE